MSALLPTGPQLVNSSDARWFSSDWPHISLPTGVNGTYETLQLATANEVRTPLGNSVACVKYSFRVNKDERCALVSMNISGKYCK
jgi:hypothetical protein